MDYKIHRASTSRLLPYPHHDGLLGGRFYRAFMEANHSDELSVSVILGGYF